MKTYNFSVFKDRIKPLSPTKGVSGNTNFYECTFEFSEDWDSLSAFAVFVGDAPYTAAILDGKCIVPHEVLEESGEIYIGVYATNGSEDNLVRISTNLIPFEVEEGALREGNTPTPPSLDVWETYIAAMNQTLIDTRDARDKANEYSVAAKNEVENAKTEVNNAKAEVNNAKAEVNNAKAEVKKAEGFATEAMNQATLSEEAKIAAGESAETAAQSADEALKARQMADASAVQASNWALFAEDKATEAEASRYNTSMHEAKTEEYKTEAATAMANAITSADEARINKEGAEKAYQDTLAETKNLVHKDNAEEISGVKNFLNGIKTARITSDGALVLETLDNPLTIYANGTYEFYSGDILVNGKGIMTDSPVYLLVTADQVITKKIQGDSENGDIEIQADGITINSGSGISFSAGTGINFNTNGNDLAIDGKSVATEEYVDSKNEFDVVSTDIVTSKTGTLNINGANIIFNAPGNINFETLNNGIYVDSKKVANENVVHGLIGTHNGSSAAHPDIQLKLDEVEAKADGASVSDTYESYEEMISAINSMSADTMKRGRNINIITMGVPDLWVAYVSDASVPYTYSSDEDFVREIEESGSVQVGFYKLAMLETQKIDLVDYAKKEDVDEALSGAKLKVMTTEEYEAASAEGLLSADTIYFVGV